MAEFVRNDDRALSFVGKARVDVDRSGRVFVKSVERLRCTPEFDADVPRFAAGNLYAFLVPHRNRIVDARDLVIRGIRSH